MESYYPSKKFNNFKIHETYFHIKVDYNQRNSLEIKSILENIYKIHSFETRYFGKSKKYIISVEEGSIKGKITLFGTLVLLGISNYGSFRQGVNQIISDSKWLSEQIINRAQQNQIMEPNNIYRTEKRHGLIGRLKRTLKKIERLSNNIDDLHNNEIRRELNKLYQNLANILELLPNEDRELILNDLSLDQQNNLPDPDPEGLKFIYDRYALKSEENYFE